MKRLLMGGCLLLLVAVTFRSLAIRWRDERDDRSLALMIDWSEIRDATARLGLSPEQLLNQVKAAGPNVLLVGASTVRDYQARDFLFPQRAQAKMVLDQLSDRGVSGVQMKAASGQWRIERQDRNWEPIEDVETGFDRTLLDQMHRAGFGLVLRVNNDPWLEKARLFSELRTIGAGRTQIAYLLNTDEIPGGPEALSFWRALLSEQNAPLLLFEFHPSKSVIKLALQAPAHTYRAHTIAPNELKDLTDDQQRARWRRAVQERSCRFLLMHASPGQSVPDFLANVRLMREDFQKHGWLVSWPSPRFQWLILQSFMNQRVGSFLALLLAIAVPVVALKSGRQSNTWGSYVAVTLLTLGGACLMAAFADNPLTRTQIVPFRGIKLAFVSAWLGCFWSLYSWSEIREQLYRPVRRVDILAALMAAALVAYLMIRMGNAGAGWKAGWEQGLRDRLEDWLVARPRFKEFGIGYPLLLLGFHVSARKKAKSFWKDGRFLIAMGMIGPISMVNTFCHIHSPLYLAFWRSVNGIVLGALFGYILVKIVIPPGRWGGTHESP